MNLVEEKQKVGRLKSTPLIKSILKKTLQREEIEIKFQREEIKIKFKCNPCNELFKSKKDILIHWHYNHQCVFCQEKIFTKNNQQFEEHLKSFHDMKKEHHQISVDLVFFEKIKKNKKIKKNRKVNEKVGNRKKVLLKKFHLCRFCKQVFLKNHQKLEDHIKEFHNIDEENFHQIFNDIEEICCQTNSNEVQNQSFTTNISNTKSNELIEEIFSKKKTPKIIIRKLDDSDRKSKLNAKRRSMKCIQKKVNICYQTNSNEAQNQSFTTNISNIESNELIEEIFSKKRMIRKLDSSNRKLEKFHLCRFCRQVFLKNHQQLKDHIKEFHNIGEENFHQIYDDIEEICCQTNSNDTQNQSFTTNISNIKSNELIEEIFSGKKTPKILIPKIDVSYRKPRLLSVKRPSMKSIHSQTKLINETLSREKMDKAEIPNVKSIKKRNSTTSNEKRKIRCLPSISIKSESQPRKKRNLMKLLDEFPWRKLT